MATLRDLLTDLDPPPGGLTKLRHRIETERERRRRFALRFAAVPALATVALLVFVFFPRAHPPAFDHPTLSSDWPVLQISVDGRPYSPLVEEGVVWIAP